jgi:LEA14-like dessication related protein
MQNRWVTLVVPFLLFSACASPPGPESQSPASERLRVALSFDHIEAERLDHAALYYRLRAEPSRSGPLEIEIRDWQFRLNRQEPEAKSPAALYADESPAAGTRLSAGPGIAVEKTLILYLDLTAPAGNSASGDEFLTALSLDLNCRRDNKPSAGPVSAEATFPRIREPVFSITSIAIIQAELINTNFKVSLRIDNPNPFPVELSSFDYELYGEGRFWADGREQELLHVPARSSAETSLLLTMNFINMSRRLLDEIVAMRLVRYRFTGEVEVDTGVSWLPRFQMGFDRSGNSVVKK